MRAFGDFINQLEARASRVGAAGTGANAGAVLDDLMKAIDYEAYLYGTFDEKQAQDKWQNVLDFISWLKEKGNGGRDGTDAEKSLLELTQMVALMSLTRCACRPCTPPRA